MERTFVMIKPSGMGHLEEIKQMFIDSGLEIVAERSELLTREKAEDLYSIHKGKPFFEGLIKTLVGRKVHLMILEGENAVERARQVMGPTDPEVARKEAPDSIRAKFAQDLTNNAVHGSDSRESFLRESRVMFNLFFH